MRDLSAATTNLDWNTWAELHNDYLHRMRDEGEKPDNRDELFEKVWSGGGYQAYGLHIPVTMDLVFESVMDEYGLDDDLILFYAMEHPESVWYERLKFELNDIVNRFEEME